MILKKGKVYVLKFRILYKEQEQTMFENMTEQQAKESILSSVKEYYETYRSSKKLTGKENAFPMHPVFMTAKRW